MSTENMRKLMALAESLDEDYRDDPNRPGWQDDEGNWHSYEDETCPHCQGWGEYIDPEGFDEPVVCPHCDPDEEPIRKSRLVKDMAMDMDMDWTDLDVADVDPADLKGFPKINEAFTRKHFQMIADTLRQLEDPEARRAQAELYAQTFAADNPRFRRDLFMKAAGVEDTLLDNKYNKRKAAPCPKCNDEDPNVLGAPCPVCKSDKYMGESDELEESKASKTKAVLVAVQKAAEHYREEDDYNDGEFGDDEDASYFDNIAALIRSKQPERAAYMLDNLDTIVEETLEALLSTEERLAIHDFVTSHGYPGFESWDDVYYRESLDEDTSEYRLAEIVGKDGLADLLADLRAGGIDYNGRYFKDLYWHFLDEYPDEIPVGSRTGRPEDPEEYVLDNLERYHSQEIQNYLGESDEYGGHGDFAKTGFDDDDEMNALLQGPECSYCDDEEPLDGFPCLNCGSKQFVGEDEGRKSAPCPVCDSEASKEGGTYKCGNCGEEFAWVGSPFDNALEESCPCGKEGCECGPDCDCEPVEEGSNDNWGVGDYVVPAWETPGENKEPAKVIAVVGDQVKVQDDFGNVHLMFPEDLRKAPVEEGRIRGVEQLPTGGADYSNYSTKVLKTLLKPGMLHRDEAGFKRLIRAELKKREKAESVEEAEVKGINDKYDDENKCKHCGDYFCTSKFGGDCPEIQMDMFGDIELDEIVESILGERGQPKDYEMSNDELAAEIEDETSEFERDKIDPEIEDEELGLRFD